MTKQYNPRKGARGIEWTDETRNAIGGCMHDCQWQMPDGTVAGCYAKELAESGVAKAAYPHGFEHHYWRPKMLKELAAGKEPRLIFVDSMSDLFAANVPEEHVRAVLDAMQAAPHHAYQSLTKAAPQILKYLDNLPPNLWVGVSTPPDWMFGKRLSIPQQQAMLRKSLEVLGLVKRATGNIVWMSAEPLSWDVTGVMGADHPLDWIVIGAASSGNRYFQPDPGHVRRLLELMDATDTPVFFKGNLRPLIRSPQYWQCNAFAESVLNRWREDFPARYRDGASIEAVAARQRNCRQYGWAENTFQGVAHGVRRLRTSDACRN